MRAWVWLAMGLVACRSSAAPHQSAEPGPAAPASTATGSSAPPPAAEAEVEPLGPEISLKTTSWYPYDGPLLVGGRSGLTLLDPKGEHPVVIRDRPCYFPRWLRPGETVLVLRSERDQPDQPERWSMLEVDIRRRSERVLVPDLLASLTRCPDGSTEELGWLEIHSDEDFRVDAERGLACMIMMDRNLNMADFMVETKVGLISRVASTRVQFGVHCGQEVRSSFDPDCESTTVRVGSPSLPRELLEPYRVEQGALLRRTGDKDEVVAGPFPPLDDDGEPSAQGLRGLASFGVHSVSPSGRWALLMGNEAEGDYFHYDWLLLDVQQGELYAITEAAWPDPLPGDELGTLDSLGNDIFAETTTLWISDDRLIVDERLVRPGEAVVDLPGMLVR